MKRQSANIPKTVCALCGAASVRTEVRPESLQYGSGDDAASINVQIPVRVCQSCHFEFTDAEADDMRHEAICRHLGVLVPSQISGIRKNYGYSRASWAELTGLGEASQARWENGQIIQNLANDRFLHLLMFPENVERLRERLNAAVDAGRQNTVKSTENDPRFPYLASIEIARGEAANFSLVA
jgi:putative zinc finger/helix-turn-helix YgiT family protein